MTGAADEDRSDDPEVTSTDGAPAPPEEADELDVEEPPWLLESISIDDPNPPQHVDLVGQIGVYLGLLSVALALFGVAAASLRVQPFGNIAIVLSLGLISVAMLLGMIFQIYVGDVPDPPE